MTHCLGVPRLSPPWDSRTARRRHLLSTSSGRAGDAWWAREEPEARIMNLRFLKPKHNKMSPESDPAQPGDSSHAARCPRGGRRRTCKRLRRGPQDEWGGGDAGSQHRGRSDPSAGTVGRYAGGGAAWSQTARGRTWESPGARAGAGGEGR